MNFGELGLPDSTHSLLEHTVSQNNNKFFRKRIVFISFGGIILTIIIIALIVGMVLIRIKKSHEKLLSNHEVPSTKFNIHTQLSTTTQLESLSK